MAQGAVTCRSRAEAPGSSTGPALLTTSTLAVEPEALTPQSFRSRYASRAMDETLGFANTYEVVTDAAIIWQEQANVSTDKPKHEPEKYLPGSPSQIRVFNLKGLGAFPQSHAFRLQPLSCNKGSCTAGRSGPKPLRRLPERQAQPPRSVPCPLPHSSEEQDHPQSRLWLRILSDSFLQTPTPYHPEPDLNSSADGTLSHSLRSSAPRGRTSRPPPHRQENWAPRDTIPTRFNRQPRRSWDCAWSQREGHSSGHIGRNVRCLSLPPFSHSGLHCSRLATRPPPVPSRWASTPW